MGRGRRISAGWTSPSVSSARCSVSRRSQRTDTGRVARASLVIRRSTRRAARALHVHRGERGRQRRDATAVVELAHGVDEATVLGERGRHDGRDGSADGTAGRRGRREELGEAALGLQITPDHDAVIGLQRLGHAIDQRPRKAQRVAHLAHGRSRAVRDEVADHARVLRRRSARSSTG